MKFLADAGISPKTVTYLNTAGHDAVHARQIGLQRATAVEIVRRARQEGRIVLTFDLDLDLDLDFDLDLGEVLALGLADNTNVLSRVSIHETAMDQRPGVVDVAVDATSYPLGCPRPLGFVRTPRGIVTCPIIERDAYLRQPATPTPPQGRVTACPRPRLQNRPALPTAAAPRRVWCFARRS